MSYGGPALGFFGVDDIATATAVASGASKVLNAVGSWFHGGAKTDQEREQRANFFQDSALLGSVTAARYILGGLQNTASHEVPYYQAARDALKATPIGQAALNQASIQGALWSVGIPDPQGTQLMVNNVKADLQQLQVAAPAAPTMTTGATTTPATSTPATQYPASIIGGAHALPGMTTTAPFNFTPWLIGGGAVLLALTLSRRSQ